MKKQFWYDILKSVLLYYNLHNDKLNQIYYFWGKYLSGSPLVFGPCGGCDGLAAVGAAREELFHTFVNVWYISTTDS